MSDKTIEHLFSETGRLQTLHELVTTLEQTPQAYAKKSFEIYRNLDSHPDAKIQLAIRELYRSLSKYSENRFGEAYLISFAECVATAG